LPELNGHGVSVTNNRVGTMNAERLAMVTTMLGLVLACSSAGLANEACKGDKKATHTLKFKGKDDQCVERVVKDSDDTDAETINACEGDTVVWKVAGPKKSVVFDGDASPFEWKDSDFKSSRIEGVVKDDAAVDGKSTPYKYSVKVDGKECVHDPVIIVDDRSLE
jgi:hypothetical protein